MTPWLLACETRCFKLLLPEMRNTAGQAGFRKRTGVHFGHINKCKCVT